MQKPDATRVAGFKAWLALGYCVRRSEKALLSHALMRADRKDEDPELDHAAEELVAETTAYSVCASSVIDAGEFSIIYLAGWSERTPIATIERTAALIDRLSRRIEDAVVDVTLGEPDGAADRAALGAAVGAPPLDAVPAAVGN